MTRNVDNDTHDLAEYYDRTSDFQFGMGTSLLGLMNIKNGDAILDVGCGTGRLAIHASQLAGPGGKVVGIDPSPHRVHVANAKLADMHGHDLSFGLGQAEDLGEFPDNTFNAAYYCAVFHWVEDEEKALKEAYRVLKPGGMIGITSGSQGGRATYRDAARVVLKGLIAEGKIDCVEYNAQWISRNMMEKMLSRAGFKNIRFSSTIVKHYFESPKELFRFLKSSAFGQSSRLPEHVRPEYRRRMYEEIEKRRTPRGIEVEWNPLYVTARKP